ncbi:MAG: hypothetical protein ACT4QD_01295 [Acidobacteriota bacterium]
MPQRRLLLERLPLQIPAIAAFAVLLSLMPLAVEARQPGAAAAPTNGTVTTAAPVYLRPDATLTPLRTLAAGTLLRINETKGDWMQVTFADPQFGRRTGWIQLKFVRTLPSLPAEPPREPQVKPSPAQPQPRPPARPGRRGAPPGGRVFFSVASDGMTAADSFKAVFGDDRVRSYGGGFQATNLWHGLFVELSVERVSQDGERVFVHDGQSFGLGIPLQLRMTPVDLVAGWRVPVFRAFVYGGGGATFVSYKETSKFAGQDEDVDDTYTGVVAVIGAEAPVWRWIHVRGDARYRLVQDVLGLGGASQAFNEKELGGWGFGVKILLGR